MAILPDIILVQIRKSGSIDNASCSLMQCGRCGISWVFAVHTRQGLPKMLPTPTHFFSAAVPRAILSIFCGSASTFSRYFLFHKQARSGIVDRLCLADALVARRWGGGVEREMGILTNGQTLVGRYLGVCLQSPLSD